MTRIDGRTAFGRAPEDVFDVLADPRNEPVYNPVVVSARKISPGRIGRGSRFVQQVRSLGGVRPVEIESVEFDRPSRLRWHVTSTGMDVEGDIEVRPDPAGSVVDWTWQFQPRGWVRLTGPLAAWVGARLERRVWRRLKAYLEAPAASSAAQDLKQVGDSRSRGTQRGPR